MKPVAEFTELQSAVQSAPASTARFRDFYELTKPRMNFLVVITTAVGYYMAAHTLGDWTRLIHTLLGTMLTASCAATLNQWMEVDFDRRMPRTRNRPLVAGRISSTEAVAFALLLGIGGISYLAICVNALTAVLGLMTVVSYLLIYTPMKRHSSLNTVIGAIPGAIPPMMGFTAVQNDFSPGALALFSILFLWQMPHFLAIAILYRDDYAAGGFKMLPVIDPKLNITSRMIVLYAAALVPVSLMPTLLGLTGNFYLVVAMLMSMAFLSFGVACAIGRQRIDARKLFFASIIYLPLLLAAMMFDKL